VVGERTNAALGWAAAAVLVAAWGAFLATRQVDAITLAVPAAMVGGLVLGLLEAFAASYLSLLTGGAFGAEYKDILAFSILILILIFRPKGLLGEVVRERA